MNYQLSFSNFFSFLINDDPSFSENLFKRENSLIRRRN
ncbi:hypothetical protein BN135_3666 [Cronobacter muytjensii 530]